MGLSNAVVSGPAGPLARVWTARCDSPTDFSSIASVKRRAARYQGFIPVNLEHPEQLAQIVADLGELRQAAGSAAQPYDIVAVLPPGTDPAPYAEAGATWWLVEFPAEGSTADLVRTVIRDGPRGDLDDPVSHRKSHVQGHG
ncbi:MAG: hypothetical protein JOY82_14800 [Streptosporangiaceae bacterium]|nr:hypothetical protein [Streptosporangiaceae bacterium]